jgi:ribosomal protein S18 acetylase RimI-like enzyme
VGLILECRKLSDSNLSTVDELSALFPHWKKVSVQRKIANTLKGKDLRFVALNEGKIIAHVRVVLGFGIHSHRAEFSSLVVEPSLRHQGVATRLMQFALKMLPAKIKLVILAVDASNKPALCVYKKLGFLEYGLLKKASQLNGKFVDNCFLFKEL